MGLRTFFLHLFTNVLEGVLSNSISNIVHEWLVEV
jgi:hypothetical protein